LRLKNTNSSRSGRKWFAKYYNSSIAIPSPEFDRLCSIAAENEVFLSVGIIEKEGGTLYCTALLIDKSGGLLYAHRKVY
jgi:predicted amidohydrolase